MPPRAVDRLRKICLALPETWEKAAWSEPTFRIVGGKIFAMHASAGTHHGTGRPAVWLHASKENQLLMIAHRPDRFFSPPYVGPSGWVGVWLDGDVDWPELSVLVEDAWRRVAPRKVLAVLDGASSAEQRTTPAAVSRASSSRIGARAKAAGRPAPRGTTAARRKATPPTAPKSTSTSKRKRP